MPGKRDWLEEVAKRFKHPATVLWRAEELRHVADALAAYVPQGAVLDMGCAEGNIAGMLFEQPVVVGLDNCEELIRHNTRRDVYRSLVLADACRMPFKDSSFGYVFSNSVIEHIPDNAALLAEVSRVLKDKGFFLFTAPSDRFGEFLFFYGVFKAWGLCRLAAWYRRKRNALLNHFHCLDHTAWQERLEKNNLKLLSYRYYMGREATRMWDLLAAVMLVIRQWPFGYAFLRKYYGQESSEGASVLIVCQK